MFINWVQAKENEMKKLKSKRGIGGVEFIIMAAVTFLAPFAIGAYQKSQPKDTVVEISKNDNGGNFIGGCDIAC